MGQDFIRYRERERERERENDPNYGGRDENTQRRSKTERNINLNKYIQTKNSFIRKDIITEGRPWVISG